tara:strand:+ start:24899 stop:25891 length:993 start_codon:yes stop_codon:yes gene_type:complete
MKRKIVKTRNEYINFVRAQNNRTNVYTTVYDFEEFTDSAKIESSVVVDRIFLDFDGHEEDISMAYRDVKFIMDWVIEKSYEHTLFFSGRGFHLFIFGEPAESIRSIQTFFREIKNKLKDRYGENSLDERVGQTTRLRRIPNTVNMSSSDENNNPYFCVPLFYDDLSLPLEEILSIAKKPRQIPFKISGNAKAIFPNAPPIESVEGEVSVPIHEGKLPLLPCLHNAVMSENPSHIARAYLVSWYRDLLTQRKPLVAQEDKQFVLDRIVEEIKTVFGIKEDVWLDWDERTTRKHAKFTVFNNYKTPNCKTKLIPEGYCIGRCWRYPDFLDGE